MKITSLSKLIVLLALFTAGLTTVASAQQPFVTSQFPNSDTKVIPNVNLNSQGFPQSPAITNWQVFGDRGICFLNTFYTAAELGPDRMELQEIAFAHATNNSSNQSPYILDQTVRI